jgi:hypothetical protein
MHGEIIKIIKNGVWVPEDDDNCHKTGKIDRMRCVEFLDYPSIL